MDGPSPRDDPVLALLVGLCWFLAACGVVRVLAVASDRYTAEQKHLADYYTRHPEKRT